MAAADLVEGNFIVGGTVRSSGEVTPPGLITKVKKNMVRIENAHGSFWLDLPLTSGKVVTVHGLLKEFVRLDTRTQRG